MPSVQHTDIIRLPGGVCIPVAELSFSFGRSPGPGGQNVNKVNTRVELRFGLADSPSLSDEQRRRACAQLASRLNRAGEIVVLSSRFRSQLRNRLDCVERFTALLGQALRPPPPPRRRTRPGRTAVARRLDRKKRNARRKGLRRPPRLE